MSNHCQCKNEPPVNFLLILRSVGADTWVFDFAIGRGRPTGLPSNPGQPHRDWATTPGWAP
ncbi:MAG: hypothetical protein HC769_25555, partial [Cyanobacteria bacterium CRU_2_1]|nr:hypothetical protein [Cyanobacteria bacterium CRU_2_1]